MTWVRVYRVAMKTQTMKTQAMKTPPLKRDVEFETQLSGLVAHREGFGAFLRRHNVAFATSVCFEVVK